MTIKIPPSLEQELVRLSGQEQLSKSEQVRRALVACIDQRGAAAPFVPALEQAGDLVGCFRFQPPRRGLFV